jgi:hypothetical protein
LWASKAGIATSIPAAVAIRAALKSATWLTTQVV